MNDFTAAISEWQSFYVMAGTAAATLIGLLFVAVSIHMDIFRRKASADLQHFAAVTFNCYFYVLLIAILFLIPKLSALGLGIPLLLLGGLGLMNAVLQQLRARRNPAGQMNQALVGKFNLPIAGLIGLTVFSVGICLRIGPSLYGLIPVVFVLLIAGSQNAWALLVDVGD